MTQQELIQKEVEIFGKENRHHVEEIFERSWLTEEEKVRLAEAYITGALEALFPLTSVDEGRFINRPKIKFVNKPT